MSHKKYIHFAPPITLNSIYSLLPLNLYTFISYKRNNIYLRHAGVLPPATPSGHPSSPAAAVSAAGRPSVSRVGEETASGGKLRGRCGSHRGDDGRGDWKRVRK